MKLISLISIALLLVFACNSEKKEPLKEGLDLPIFPKHIQQKVKNIKYLDSVKFAKVGATINAISKNYFEKTNPLEKTILSEKVCKKSKGYTNSVWEGQNDCSWATEKNNLKKFANWATRTGDTLTLKLKNSENITYLFDRSNPDQVLYYQFKTYLQNVNFFIVETIQKGKCRISNLINASDGAIFPIKGTVYFSEAQNVILLASFNNQSSINCSNKIEWYKISDAKLEKIWHISTGKWGVTDARIVNQKEILLEQSTIGIPAEYKYFAKLLINKPIRK